MNADKLDIVFLGLSITSTWGNGHATTYRGLLKELHRSGHSVRFLERDVPWYASHREFSRAPYAEIHLYSSLEELHSRYTAMVRDADVVIVGSYVPDGIAVGEWVVSTARGIRAFYDIDTPVTLAAVQKNKCEYLSRRLCRQYDLYLSFTGGPTLRYIENSLGSARARALYCSVDPDLYYPERRPMAWDMAYLGTYASDRQASLEKLLLKVAGAEPERRFAVAGPQYPKEIEWPGNVDRVEHLPASQHREFYNSQRYALNLTRRDMVRAGYSPSVRLFEAGACGTPIISDEWPGLQEIFSAGTEILLARSPADVARHLRMPETERQALGDRMRQKTLRFHTAATRASELTGYVLATLESVARSKQQGRVFLKPSQATAAL